MFSLKTLKNYNSSFLINKNSFKKLLTKIQSTNYQIKEIISPSKKQLTFKSINNRIHNTNKFNFSNNTNPKENSLPDHLLYEIPKYSKNPENVDFPWLIGGAPFLELKVNCKKYLIYK